MFTGIVQELGTVLGVKRAQGLVRVQILAPKTAAKLSAGESVAVNGVCLSVVRLQQGVLSFEAIPQTLRLTNLSTLSAGARVNLETSLSLSDRLNGHLVLGHVDGTGRVVRRAVTAGETVLGIRIEPRLRRYLVPKGSIAVDGVSLTVGPDVTPTTFLVFLIPETLHQTTLGARRLGALVNIEVDYVAKLIVNFASRNSLAQLLRGVTRRNRHAALDW